MMTHFKMLKTSVCAAALFSANAAVADVTAQQVWDDWKANLAIYGEGGISIGSEEASGGVVTVNDLVLSMEEDGSSVNANFGTLTFTEQGDGTVAVTMTDNYPITIVPEADALVTINVSQSNMKMIVSGEEGDMTYDVTADRYAFELAEVVENGAPVLEGDALLAINNLQGTYNVKVGDLRNIDYDLAMASLDMLVDVAEPGGDGKVTVSGKINNMTAASTIAMPLEIDPDKPEDMFANGFALSGNYGFAGADYIFDMNVDGSATAGSVSLGGGATNFAMDNAAMSYDVGAAGLDVNLQSGDFPFPIALSMSEYGLGFGMPVAATDEPTDFAMKLKLTDLTINDEIWGLGDPAGILPRDPASINLDLTGKAKLFFDLLDPEQAAAMDQADVPGELHAVTLSDLLISAGGAMVTGAGDFTFDNSDLTTFDGMPRPLGDASIQIKGANALIDNLVAMGLLPEDQASMGRLMMGMFARTTGDDQLETKVEVNAEGHLIVNGQRMQ